MNKYIIIPKFIKKSPAMNQAGFTLVELLVVIAILGILASAVLIAVDPAAQLGKARNTTRKAILKSYANALDRYKLFQGTYPVTSTWCSAPGSYWSGGCPDPTNWIPGLVASGELKLLAKDPRQGQVFAPCNDGSAVAILYISNGVDYKLVDYCGMEVAGSVSPSDPFLDPAHPGCCWAIYSPGAAGW